MSRASMLRGIVAATPIRNNNQHRNRNRKMILWHIDRLGHPRGLNLTQIATLARDRGFLNDLQFAAITLSFDSPADAAAQMELIKTGGSEQGF